MRCIYWYVFGAHISFFILVLACAFLLTVLPCLQSFHSQNIIYSPLSILAPRLGSVFFYILELAYVVYGVLLGMRLARVGWVDGYIYHGV